MSLQDDIEKILQRLVTRIIPDPDTWLQMGKISAADMARRRGLFAKADERKREAEALEAKIEELKAAVNADSKEWWAYVYKQYGLPSGDYSILDDGRILQRPEEGE